MRTDRTHVDREHHPAGQAYHRDQGGEDGQRPQLRAADEEAKPRQHVPGPGPGSPHPPGPFIHHGTSLSKSAVG